MSVALNNLVVAIGEHCCKDVAMWSLHARAVSKSLVILPNPFTVKFRFNIAFMLLLLQLSDSQGDGAQLLMPSGQ